MNFLKKLLGGRSKAADIQEKKNPENTKLTYLLNIYGEHPSDDNYRAVMDEILNGNSFLLLPSVNQNEGSVGWTTIEAKTLNLTSVFNVDGLKVLGAFSDECALLEWSKKETQYTAMRTQDVIEGCKHNNVDRVVINSNQKNMYVLERNREHFKSTTVEKATNILVGTPSNPLKKHLIDKLVENFRKVDTVEEAYQYAQSMNDEVCIVLGIKMSVVSDNSRAALLNAVTNSLSNEKLDMPLDVMVLETEDWLATVRDIHNSLFYKR
jgi:glycogen debranching enzyme